jgi:hypothetical protein
MSSSARSREPGRSQRLGRQHDVAYTWNVDLSTDDLDSIRFHRQPASGWAGNLHAHLKRRQALRVPQFSICRARLGATEPTYTIFFTQASVFGDHGLTKILDSLTGRNGLAASDMIRYIASRFAKKLSDAGVEQTSYPIKQAAWLDDPTDPYDMWMQLNDLHLNELNVFEGPTLNFAPADLTTIDWEVRAGEEGRRSTSTATRPARMA